MPRAWLCLLFLFCVQWWQTQGSGMHAITNKSPFFKDGITRFWNSAPGFIRIRQQLSFSALPFSGPDGVEF